MIPHCFNNVEVRALGGIYHSIRPVTIDISVQFLFQLAYLGLFFLFPYLKKLFLDSHPFTVNIFLMTRWINQRTRCISQVLSKLFDGIFLFLYHFHLQIPSIVFHACQTVLSLAFFMDAAKEMWTNYVSLWQWQSAKRYNLDLAPCWLVELCVNTTLVHSPSDVPFLCLSDSYVSVKWINKQTKKTFLWKQSGTRTGLK